MKLTYKQRIFSYFLIIFALFAICIVVFEQKEEKNQRTEALEDHLDGYAEMIHTYLQINHIPDTAISQVKPLIDVLPANIRVTIINAEGKVIFDKNIKQINSLENHLDRPEIRTALYQTKGTNIRKSASTQQEYLYYAKHYEDKYIRIALPYNIGTKNLLKADNMFIYIVLVMFIVVFILLNYAAGRFGKSITQLKSLTTAIRNNKPPAKKINFPDDELGEIGNQLVAILDEKEKIKHEIEIEREKLIKHFQVSHEGICIFDKEFKKIYANTIFFQYFNMIVDQPVFNLEVILKERIFDPVIEFLSKRNEEENYHSFQINNNGKIFLVQTIVFEDKSFELTIKDITRAEKTRLMKQEMTSNIAHELRTPVTSLRGYLETLNELDLPAEKQAQFIDRAYQQSIRLSNIIDDVSLISKIEEASSQFKHEKVNLSQLINEVRIDLTDKLKAKDILMSIAVNDHLVINGNYSLIYSIFRNLVDNSINYGGEHIEIHISNYMEDKDYVYFSYCDTGKGVEAQHLPRLFERFYRINDGRTRDTGGSGLGLSIVKNAVLFHKGEIQVRNRAEGGLEFFFTLKK